jgi:hypothetical protein
MNPDCLNEFQVAQEQAAQGCSCPSCGGTVVVTRAPVRRKSSAEGISRTHDIRPVEEPDEETTPVVLALPELCPQCNQEMPAGAVLCVGCGYDHRIGRKRSTTRSERKSQAVIPLRGGRELALIGGGFGGLLLLIVTSILASRYPLTAVAFFFLATVALAAPCVLVFLANARVSVSPKGDGRALCTAVYQIVQLPFHQRQLVLSPHHRLVWCHETPPEAIAFLLVLVALGLIPGIVWWILILSKRSFLRVEDTVSGKTQRFSILWGEQSLRELIDTIQEVIDLQVDRV